VSYFFEPLLSAHNPEEVETYCYADVRRPDETTRRLQCLTRQWRSVTDMEDAAVRRQIAADGIDVLVELAGHTADTRLTVLAPKPAPVTVNWLGYPGTTGLPTVDFRLTDAEADPPGASDGWHTEELVRLPHGFLCYRPPTDAPPVAPAPALSRGFVTFGSFNNPKKVTSRCIELWAAILGAVPTTRLLLKGELFAEEHTRKRVEGQLARAGVALERVDFRTRTAATAEHLDAYGEVDIGLDPFPYNGTTTTCEAFWMGVPVLTLRGGHHAARVGVSLLTRIGLGELIADHPDDYVAKAVALARDRDRLQALRASMRERMRVSPLMDERDFARRFEAALRDMWRRWCQSAP
jgi:predicted O-linked N-acetylglucosamine transferase (SPINDLY family)